MSSRAESNDRFTTIQAAPLVLAALASIAAAGCSGSGSSSGSSGSTTATPSMATSTSTGSSSITTGMGSSTASGIATSPPSSTISATSTSTNESGTATGTSLATSVSVTGTGTGTATNSRSGSATMTATDTASKTTSETSTATASATSNAMDAGAADADTSTSCGFDPVTPNATPQTRKVLCYLHSIYGKHILSGQEENNDNDGINTVFQATGKYPAIRAFDVNNSLAPSQCVSQWQSGGLCMFGYHMDIDGNNFNVAENINNVLTPGKMENTSFNQDLDRIAQYVQPLQQIGGVAILRLFHEAGDSCNWFWWTMGTSQQWQELFKYAFKYLTQTKGLNNVLWIAPLCGSPSTAYNPGSQYIDLGGADDYVTAGDYEPLTSLFQKTENAFPNMMVALHECGSIPDPNQLQSSGTKWLFFNVWSEYETAPNNPASHLQEVYSNKYVLTRSDLPSFK